MELIQVKNLPVCLGEYTAETETFHKLLAILCPEQSAPFFLLKKGA